MLGYLSSFVRMSNPRMAKKKPVMGKKQPESQEELLRYLEQVSGRRIRTRDDIKAYVEEMAARKAADQPSVRWWRKAKTITLIGLTAFAFIQYYMMDVMLQIMSLRETTFFVPVSAPAPVVKSMAEFEARS
jgi:hypothetical protein